MSAGRTLRQPPCFNRSRSCRASARSVFARCLSPCSVAVSAGSARCTTAPTARSSSTTNRHPVVASSATANCLPANRATNRRTPARSARLTRAQPTSPVSRSIQSAVVCARCWSIPHHDRQLHRLPSSQDRQHDARPIHYRWVTVGAFCQMLRPHGLLPARALPIAVRHEGPATCTTLARMPPREQPMDTTCFATPRADARAGLGRYAGASQ